MFSAAQFATKVVSPLLRQRGPCLLSKTALRAFSSASGTTDLIINAVGEDRLGIVSDISKVVIDCGGNVGESVAGRLGSHFSLMMLVTIPGDQLDDLKQKVLAVPDMDAAVFDTKASALTKQKKTPMIGYSGKFTLEGADNPGIVHRITSALAKSSLNIVCLHTETEIAPYGGALLFRMSGVVVATEPLANGFDVSKIKKHLHELGDDLNCEVTLEDSVDESYVGSFYAS